MFNVYRDDNDDYVQCLFNNQLFGEICKKACRVCDISSAILCLSSFIKLKKMNMIYSVLIVIMIFKTSLLLLSSLSAIYGKNYILLPKEKTNDVSLSFVHNMAEQLDLEFLTMFQYESNVLPFYIAPSDVFHRYKDVLEALFDIEEDKEIHLDGANQFVLVDHDQKKPDDTWHLRRVTQRENDPSALFNYTNPGSCFKRNDTNINMYIIDTGIDVNHTQFEGRAEWLANFADDQDEDCNSHGTHVAGIVGSKNYGVCVDAKLYAIKVLNCRGSGTLSSVIQGIAFAFESHAQSARQSKVKSVVNMSLGGGKSRAIDRAVQEVMSKDSDFYMVVAAGNENSDACDGSPSGSPYVLTVMASNKNDKRAYFSNWGKCADVYAPGVDIVSTVPGGKFAKYSGTSMASPLTAGVLLHYLDMFDDMNMTQLVQKVVELSTKNVIEGQVDETSSDLVYLSR